MGACMLIPICWHACVYWCMCVHLCIHIYRSLSPSMFTFLCAYRIYVHALHSAVYLGVHPYGTLGTYTHTCVYTFMQDYEPRAQTSYYTSRFLG